MADQPHRSGEHALRLQRLRALLAAHGADGFFVPIADPHMSEYVGEDAQRLRWLTGFTGSAGLGVVLPGRAAIFTDGRYAVQARSETQEIDVCVTPSEGTPQWLAKHASTNAVMLYDPWLHTRAWVRSIAAATAGAVSLRPAPANLVDAIWIDRPSPPDAPARVQPLSLTGKSLREKLDAIRAGLAANRSDAVLISALDSVCWALNLRGADAPCLPVVRAFLIVRADTRATVFIDAAKLTGAVRAHLGSEVEIKPYEQLLKALGEFEGKRVELDPDLSVEAIYTSLERAEVVESTDPCLWPRAIKTEAEIKGARAAHLRDGVALCRFLHWLDSVGLTQEPDECEAAARLEDFRREASLYRTPSFPTIAACGPNAALPHYVPKPGRARKLKRGEVFLLDSGGQYDDGTTDVTRTIALGAANTEAKRHFTLALKCHLAIAAIQIPPGTTGGQLDPLARQFLWSAGLDYATGTGHGVGSCLSVHEGPVFIGKAGGTRAVDERLQSGILLTVEPGLYLEGRYGVRTENVYYVAPARGAHGEEGWMGFDPLTLAPIDRALIEDTLLTPPERAWIDAYHARVASSIAPHLDAPARAWLEAACAPL